MTPDTPYTPEDPLMSPARLAAVIEAATFGDLTEAEAEAARETLTHPAPTVYPDLPEPAGEAPESQS